MGEISDCLPTEYICGSTSSSANDITGGTIIKTGNMTVKQTRVAVHEEQGYHCPLCTPISLQIECTPSGLFSKNPQIRVLYPIHDTCKLHSNTLLGVSVYYMILHKTVRDKLKGPIYHQLR